MFAWHVRTILNVKVFTMLILSDSETLRSILKMDILILIQTLSYAIYTVVKPPPISPSKRNSLILLSDE